MAFGNAQNTRSKTQILTSFPEQSERERKGKRIDKEMPDAINPVKIVYQVSLWDKVTLHGDDPI